MRPRPQVIVSDIRMPPNFQQEGIDGCKEIRKRHPGTGVVILSQYDDPDYAISLLSEGAAGYAYLLKDRIAEGDQLARAIREVATGGLDARPRDRRRPRQPGALGRGAVARGRGAPHAWWPRASRSRRSPPRGTPPRPRWPTTVERLWVRLAQGVSSGADGALKRLRRLHEAIVEREEQGETLARLLPGGVAEKLRQEGRAIGDTERLEVTVLMSDIRGYSTIAEHADPAALAAQLNTHRAEMNRAIIGEGGTVMQYVGDAVMAVFGAPVPSDRPRRSGPRRGAGHARRAGQGEPGLAAPKGWRPSGWGSASPPARSPRRCSARRSGSSTPSSATP